MENVPRFVTIRHLSLANLLLRSSPFKNSRKIYQCRLLLDPDLDVENFVVPDAIGADVAPNPYWPLGT